MLKRSLCLMFAIASLVPLASPRVEATVISPGTPTTTVPTYLADGSYLFGITVTLGPDQFLLPVEIAGATRLQNWQFDLLFNNTVVNEVDPLDGTAGIYGAQFTSGDPTSLSFILGGFPFNVLGRVDAVAGSYPSFPTGPSGNGTLAFVLFEFLPEQQNNNPKFRIENPVVEQGVPEPGTLVLLAGGLMLLGTVRVNRRGRLGAL